jgi:hypothetical protein
LDDSLTPTAEPKKSRRGLLALVGAGGAAAVAALLGRRNGAEAHGTVHYDSNDSDPAVHGNNTASGPGVWGAGNTGIGVFGYSSSHHGVSGSSNSSKGVYGYSNSATGVRGDGNPGVEGFGGNGNGVYGSSNSATGVKGNSASGAGVKGTGKPGVYGISGKDNASAVRGDGTKPGSVALYGKNTPGRRALRTRGQVQMDCARKVKLSNKSNTLTLPANIRAGSNAIVMAVVQGAPGNEALVRRAFRVDSTHIRIDFDKKPANPTVVGYWVIHTG